ncbi:hypothetical protein SELMODRAFT_419359 [Selaginella moellendorffii]|uniref:Uncharacterized protein n=1 Tax=Selaginella moellendorffii TaxID=88036 RepID=D8S8N8_SELML|nr:hypothetical protein SELMODRAFT_419359 [Selaginella moellendorffii]
MRRFLPYRMPPQPLRNYKLVYASEIGGALVWEESTIDAGGPHAKAIREAVRQIPRSMRGLFVLREGATYWHPRMPMHSRTLQQEERDVVSCGCTIATLAIATREVPNENDRRLARGGLYEMGLKAYALHIWNALNQLRGASSLKEEGDQHKSVDSILKNLQLPTTTQCLSLDSPNLVKVRMIIPPAEFINCLIFDQDFGENFRSWIVDIIRDMSSKELSKFHHFAVDSPEFRPREPIWIQVER